MFCVKHILTCERAKKIWGSLLRKSLLRCTGVKYSLDPIPNSVSKMGPANLLKKRESDMRFSTSGFFHKSHWDHFEFFRKFAEIFANECLCLSAVPTTPAKKDKNFEIKFLKIFC